MEDIVALVAVVAPFAFVIALVGMILHYKDRKRMQEAAPTEAANAANADLVRVADCMEKRIEALEQILDAEAPGWRKKHERS